MSFSSDIKQELNKTSNLANKEMVKHELIGYLISGNTSVLNNKEIKFSTESDYNINRFSKLLSNLDINHNINVSRKNICNKSEDKRYQFYRDKRKGNLFGIRKRNKPRKPKSRHSRSFYGSRFDEQSRKRISFRSGF